MKFSGLKTAIITESIIQKSGSDKLVLSIAKEFNNPDIYTFVFDNRSYDGEFSKYRIYAALNPNNFFREYNAKVSRNLSVLQPFYFESLDLSKYDLVITVSAGASKGITTKSSSKHLNIICTPPHYQFGQHRNLRGHAGRMFIKNFITPFTDQFLRIWDFEAAQRADHTVSISKYVRNIVKATYKRDSEVLYPPVDYERFSKLETKERDDYFVIVSRLFEYKRIDRAISACNKLEKELHIVGDGPDRKYLESMAGPTIIFMGELSDNEVERELAGCQALIFPGTDDFGITPVEALATGKPVIGYNQGGIRETMIQGKTGELFDLTKENSLEKVLEEFSPKKYDPEICRKHAEHFSKKAFSENFTRLLTKLYSE